MTESFIHPLVLGKKHFATNLIQAPLAGISSAPFRELIWHFGGAAYCCTEMVSAKTLLGKPEQRYIYKSPKEGPLCFQLSGNNPKELHEATLRAISFGADLIDLNCGCPVDKIRKKNCGSKLLSQSQKLYELIKSIKSAAKDIPVTAKIRVDAKSGDQFNQDVVKAINDAGADAIIVHGRHWTEHYETAARLDEIASIVSASNIPIIGNGDVKDYESLQKMFELTKCAGAMIGRASSGRPWLFQQLITEAQGKIYTPPTPKEIGELLLAHISALSHLENETLAIMQARKLGKYYLQAADLAHHNLAAFNKLYTYEGLVSLVKQIFSPLP